MKSLRTQMKSLRTQMKSLRTQMRSLRTQMMLSLLLTLLLTVGLIAFFSNWFIQREFEKYVTELSETRSENIVADLGRQYDGFAQSWNHEYVHVIGMYSLYDGYILTISDRNGSIVWDAANHDMSLCGQIMDEILARMEKLGDKGGFSAHTHDIIQNGRAVGSVSITYYGPFFLSEDDFTFLSAMNTVLAAIGTLAGVFSIVVGYLLARRISRPIAKIAYIAKQIAQGNYAIRFERGTKTRELDDLVAAINHLAGALSDQEALRKRMTADIAHELRTPLTAVGSHLEAMIEGLWDVSPERLRGCHDEIKRLAALVADLEKLAKIEGDSPNLYKTRIDLMETVRTVAQNMNAEVRKKGQTVTVTGTSSFVNADKDRMNQVLHNLFSNAVKYTPEGGGIRLEVADAPDGGTVTVADDGIGIPAQELPLIFERFYRTDKSRSRLSGGAGIGLAIVQSIVSAHGGSVSVDSECERGTRFTVWIPKGQ